MREFIKQNRALILLVLLAAFTSLFMLGSKSFSTDEIFSLQLSPSISLASKLWFNEFNMWFYYFMLHFWLPFGKGEFIVRFPSAVFAVAAIPFIYKVVDRLFDKKIAMLTSVLTLLNVFFVLYAQDARGYSLSLLLCTISTYLFILLVFNENNKNYLLQFLYFLVSALAIYTHIFSFLIIAAQFASLFFLPLKKYFKTIVMWMFLTCLTIIPMFISPSFHSSQVNWIAKPSIISLVETFYILSGDFAPLAMIYFLIVLVFFPWKRITQWKNLFTLMLLGLPIALIFLFSIFIKSIYQSRYFIMLLPYLTTVVSVCIYRIRPKWLFIATFSLSILFSIARVYLWYAKIDLPAMTISNNNPDWTSTTNYLTTNSKEGDCAIFFTYFGLDKFKFYNTSAFPKPVNISGTTYTLSNGIGENVPDPDLKKTETLSCPNVWLVLSGLVDVGPNHLKHENIEQALRAKYIFTKSTNFYNIQIEKFVLSK